MSSAILATVEALVEAGASPEIILAAVRAAVSQQTDALERRRESDRKRQQEKRDKVKTSSNVTSRDVTVTDPSRDARVVNSSSSLHSEGKKEETTSPRKLDENPDEFSIWYREYPNKVARAHALKAFSVARKLPDVTLDVLLDGLRRYVANKPPDHGWKHPATWLNGQCWLDEPAVVISIGKPSLGSRHEPRTTVQNAARNLAETLECAERGDFLDDPFGIRGGSRRDSPPRLLSQG